MFVNRKDIVFYDDILIEHTGAQKLLLKSTLRSYVNTKLKLTKMFLYLRLVENHLTTDTLPPVVKFDFDPPGIDFDSNSSVMRLWNARLSHCSITLLRTLHTIYVDEVQRLSWLSRSYFTECVRIMMIRQQWSYKESVSYIKQITHGMLHANINTLEQMCSDEELTGR